MGEAFMMRCCFLLLLCLDHTMFAAVPHCVMSACSIKYPKRFENELLSIGNGAIISGAVDLFIPLKKGFCSRCE